MSDASLPEGLHMRPATLADVEQAVCVMNSSEIEYCGEPETTENLLRRTWSQAARKPEENARVIVTPEDEIVASVDTRNKRHIKIDVELDVLPAYRGQVELPLMRWVEERAQAHIALAPEDAQVLLGSWAYQHDTQRQQLWKDLGFELVRYFWTMKRELTQAPEQPQLAPGIRLRTFKELQKEAPQGEERLARALFAAHEEAFSDHWGYIPNIYEEWRQYHLGKEADLSLFFLAMDGEEIVAYARCADEGQQGGWVYTLGVRRAWRRQGQALALLHHAFGEFYQRGTRTIRLGVDAQSLTGATRLYECAGMQVERRSAKFEKVLRPGRNMRTLSLNQA
ncbi:GNAT family N-acetyltransferase [Ktedonobacter racemifer]|uniref:GCN5-related N-acetyltransferase n=1 Tax=Ktedonobacter racemifer DSM 44963 TaxID=485913 RepID=D6TKJ9_KTERA|nr:GNAT family N-acetyltransferase [Ktedonobacter racemifer]EFH86299.1 GCN5-related N-acetyltransferase [Ktedonobacter racemifer DSM 44963]